MARGVGGKKAPRGWSWLVAGLVLLASWQLLQREAGPGMPPVAETRPAVATGGDQATAPASDAARDPALAFLPREAHATLALIDRGGPFPHRQDGSVFQNRERLLPPQPRGHYREYTVDTPGLDHRGARRIVTGGDPPAEWYYTADHYRSFRAFERSRTP